MEKVYVPGKTKDRSILHNECISDAFFQSQGRPSRKEYKVLDFLYETEAKEEHVYHRIN